MTSLKASKSFTYATRHLQAGDPFEAPEKDAHVLVAIRKATRSAPKLAPVLTSSAEAKAPDPTPASPEDDTPASDEADLEALRTEAAALGIEVDRRWKQARLAKEIAAAKPAQD